MLTLSILGFLIGGNRLYSSVCNSPLGANDIAVPSLPSLLVDHGGLITVLSTQRDNIYQFFYVKRAQNRLQYAHGEIE